MQTPTYMVNRQKSSRNAVIAGLSLAVAVHICALFVLKFNGLSYIYPPPEEQSFVIDFTEETEEIKPQYGKEPVAEEVDLQKPVELVQKSESPVAEAIPNETQESASDDFGDVPVAAPEPEKPQLDPRASFPGMGKKPSTATTPHTSKEASPNFRNGQPDGNAENNILNGRSNAHLQGRSVEGGLAEPKYNLQESGIVIVTIYVDVYGNVRNAIAGAPGTTIDDKTLWAEARNAAMRTHFSKLNKITEDTPELQEGRITYIFKLK